MTTPNDIVTVMWITEPFLLASLLFALRSCVRNLTLHRVILVAACFLAMIANANLFAMFGGYQVNISLSQVVGVISYNLGVWTTKVYVCLRMSKLSPSPVMSSAFQHLAYVAGTLFVMTMTTFIASCIEFYKTHPFEQPATTNDTATACNLVASMIYEISSIFLHVKCLRIFASSSPTGIKLDVISCSSLFAIAFGLAFNGAQMAQDLMTGLLMAGMEIAVLPSSIVLGEAIAVRIGKRSGNIQSSVGSKGHSKTAGTTSSVDKTKVSKPPTSTTSTKKEEPVRQSATLANI